MKRNVIITVVAFAVLIATQVAPLRAVIFENALFRSIDEQSTAYVDDAFERALITFALARASNAAISLLQGTELDIQPWGVGVTLSVGEVLDPVNDMVERFSWVMMVSLMSLGIQKFLIEISPWLSVQFLLACGVIFIGVGAWPCRHIKYNLPALGRRIVFVALVVRFCIPCVAYLNNQVYDYFLDSKYLTAKAEVEVGNQNLKELSKLTAQVKDIQTQEVPGDGEGFLAKSWELFGQVKDSLDLEQWRNTIEAKFEAVQDKASRMVRSFLELMTVFFLNTILLPIGFLWGLLQLLRIFTSYHTLIDVEHKLKGKISKGGNRGT